MSAKKVYFDTLRHLGFAGISGTYAAIGSALTVNPRTVLITNNTNGDIILSTDNTNAAGQIFVPANSFLLYDLEANMDPNKDDAFVIAVGTIFYVKQSTASSIGDVWLQFVYAAE